MPSAEDIAATKAEFEELYEQFKSADNLKNFVALNSDRLWDDTFYSKDELSRLTQAFADYAFGAPAAASAIDSTAEAFMAVRVADRKMMPDSVSFSYALFPVAEQATADSLLAAVRKTGASADLMPSGWMTLASMASNGMDVFSEVFDMKPGEVRLLNIDQYQMLAVLKAEQATKVKEKVKLAFLRKNINPSDDTYRDYQMKAADLADRSDGSYDKFAAVVKEDGLPVIPMQRVTIDTRRIGIIDNARSVVHWVFDRKTKKGSVSDVITVDNKYYVVAAVTEARKEGRVPLEEVKENILTELINQKKVENLVAEVQEKISGGETLEALAEKFNTSVNHRDGISFSNVDMSLEPSFVGAVVAAPEGKVVGPVKGQIGVYFFEVTNTTSGEYYTEADALNRNLQRQSALMQQITDIISQEADVKDYRAKFY